MSKGTIGIVVSGTPAPGINGVIRAAVVEAINNGYKVKGFVNGFKGACKSKPDSFIDLSFKEVS
jgi:6-phosphofructokinase